MKAIHIFLSGRVQNVGLRYFTKRLAEEHEIMGAVRNRTDGKVEIWADGEEEQLSAFLAKLQKGPAFSHVDNIEKREQTISF